MQVVDRVCCQVVVARQFDFAYHHVLVLDLMPVSSVLKPLNFVVANLLQVRVVQPSARHLLDSIQPPFVQLHVMTLIRTRYEIPDSILLEALGCHCV